jgi:hypothetical protein
MAGGRPARLSMTQGNCPPYIPLQSTVQVQNQTCPDNNNGSITLSTNYGVAPYSYSINNGVTYQSSNVFNGLGASTYTVITKDSATPTNNTSSSIVTILSNKSDVINYDISVNLIDTYSISLGTQVANWEVSVTPSLPIGVVISFNLNVGETNRYYEPGLGEIDGTTIVKKNNSTVTPSLIIPLSDLVTNDRSGCSPYLSGETTSGEIYTLTIGNGDVISGTSTSILVINEGSIDDNGCTTKVDQSILVNTFEPTISGGVCISVRSDSTPRGIVRHTLEL